MSARMKVKAVVAFCLVFSGIAANVHAQDCVYKDEFGAPIMHIGGAAIAGMMIQLDPDGDRFGIPHDYEIWDLNADGVLDKMQFALLTEVLCSPPGTPHATMNFNEIKATYAANLAMYWNLVNTMKAAEADMIAAGPFLRQVGIEINTAATARGVLNDALPPEVFGAAALPLEWQGSTWGDFGLAVREVGDGINWMNTNGYIGSPTAPIWLLLDNEATAYTFAALLGFDSGFTMELLTSSYMGLMNQFLSFVDINWAYVMSILGSYGLNVTSVANAQDAIETLGFDSSLVPDVEDLAITSNGEDALHADVIWGDVTLGELFTTYGNDIESLWEEVLTQLPPMPVGGAFALALLGAMGLLGGAGVVARRVKRG